MTSTTETQPIGEVGGEQAFRPDGFIEPSALPAGLSDQRTPFAS